MSSLVKGVAACGSERNMRQFRTYRALIGARDGLGLFAYPQPGLAIVLWMLFDRDLAPSSAERRVLHRVAGHIDSAFRLRYRPDLAVAAVLAPDGRFLDLDDPSIERAQRERLTGRVITLERTRLRDRRKDPDALDDWQALINGRYSVVLRDDPDGKRYYLLVRNAAVTEPHARFSTREIEVLRLAARGFTGKGITYTLGLTPQFGIYGACQRCGEGWSSLATRAYRDRGGHVRGAFVTGPCRNLDACGARCAGAFAPRNGECGDRAPA